MGLLIFSHQFSDAFDITAGFFGQVMSDLFPVFLFAAGALRGVEDAAITRVIAGEGHVQLVLCGGLFKFSIQRAVIIDASRDVPFG